MVERLFCEREQEISEGDIEGLWNRQEATCYKSLIRESMYSLASLIIYYRKQLERQEVCRCSAQSIETWISCKIKDSSTASWEWTYKEKHKIGL